VELEGDQMILEAVHGQDYHGYVAVDQIHQNTDPQAACETVPAEAAPTTPPPATTPAADGFPHCTFEEGTCGWYSSTDNGLEWRHGTSNGFGTEEVPHPQGDMAGNLEGELHTLSLMCLQFLYFHILRIIWVGKCME